MASIGSTFSSLKQSGFLRKALVVFIPIAIVLVSFMGVGAMMASKKPPEVAERSRPTLAVMAIPAYTDTVVLDVRVQGQTRPRTEIDIVPQVGGKVTYVSPSFVAGGAFKKGDVLLSIEKSDYQVAVIRAEANVARAQQVLIREKSESAIAAKDWADLGNGSEPTDLTLRKPQMAEAEASLKSAQADLDNAKLQLARTRIIAPFDGRIRDRFADVGQYVSVGTRLARVFSTETVEIPLSLTDADLTRLDIPVAYTSDNSEESPDVLLSTTIAGQKRVWHGKIVRTDGAFNPQTRALSAIAEVRDPYGKGASEGGIPLTPGLFVDAEITGKTLSNALVIPRDGLRPENKVYVVDDKGVATSRDAVVLDTNFERAILSAGVEAGELIIISPLEKSQISLTFKVLDGNDPTKILVEPPKPDSEKNAEAQTDKKSSDDGTDNQKANTTSDTSAVSGGDE